MSVLLNILDIEEYKYLESIYLERLKLNREQRTLLEESLLKNAKEESILKGTLNKLKSNFQESMSPSEIDSTKAIADVFNGLMPNMGQYIQQGVKQIELYLDYNSTWKWIKKIEFITSIERRPLTTREIIDKLRNYDKELKDLEMNKGIARLSGILNQLIAKGAVGRVKVGTGYTYFPLSQFDKDGGFINIDGTVKRESSINEQIDNSEEDDT